MQPTNARTDKLFDLGGLHPWAELANLALLGMEACCVAAWFRLLTQSGLYLSYAQAFAVLYLLGLFAYLFLVLMAIARLQTGLQRFLTVALLAGGAWAGLEALLYFRSPLGLGAILQRLVSLHSNGIPAEYPAILILGFVCWRASRLVGRSIGFLTAQAQFKLAAAALFVYALLSPLTGELLLVPVLLCLFFGLLGMGAARIATLARLRGGRTIPFNRKSLGGISLGSLGLALLAFLAAVLVSGKLQGLLVALGVAFFALFAYTINILMLPLTWLIAQVFSLFARLMQHSVPQLAEAAQAIGPKTKPLPPDAQNNLLDLLRQFGSRALPLLAWGVLILAIYLLLRSFRDRYILLEQPPTREEGEKLDADWLGRLRRALASTAQAWADGLAGLDLRRARQLQAVARIRRIYAQLMELCTELGSPRPPACTPLEFLPEMLQLLPGYRTELVAITEAYQSVRYGELPETLDELKLLEQAWQRLQVGAHGLLKPARSKGEAVHG